MLCGHRIIITYILPRHIGDKEFRNQERADREDFGFVCNRSLRRRMVAEVLLRVALDAVSCRFCAGWFIAGYPCMAKGGAKLSYDETASVEK